MKLRLTALTSSLAALSLAPALLGAPALDPIPDTHKTGGFAIGCQAYTFNRFTAFEAIEKTAAAGGKVIEFYPGQRLSPTNPEARVDHNAPDDVIDQLKAKLAQHDIKAVNYGVVGIPNDEANARKIFVFAKKMGMRAVTTESTESIDVIEKLVKEFNIGCAYHNHPRQPNNPNYKVWDPNYILELLGNRDPRIGACADTGHWARSGINAVEALKILEGRVISAHLKDLNAFGRRDAHDVPFGTGVVDIPAVLDELKRQGFNGNLSIEYEHNWEHSVPEVAQCVGFVRGYGARR
jgi:sugar phosphate isomerase/epimerase